MILKKLKLRGVAHPFKDTTVEIDYTALPEGIICYVGKKGAGKSTLLETSATGVLFRSFPYYKESFVQHATARDAFADLTWEMHGTEWRALVQADPQFNAGKGKSEAYLYREGVPVAGPILAGFDQALARELPSEDFFLASVFAVQGGRGGFFGLTPADRKDLIAELLDTGHLQGDSEEAGRACALMLTEITANEREIRELNEKAHAARELRDKLAQLETARNEICDAHARMDERVTAAAASCDERASAVQIATKAMADRERIDHEIRRTSAAAGVARGRHALTVEVLAEAENIAAALERLPEVRDAKLAIEKRTNELADDAVRIAGGVATTLGDRRRALDDVERIGKALDAARAAADKMADPVELAAWVSSAQAEAEQLRLDAKTAWDERERTSEAVTAAKFTEAQRLSLEAMKETLARQATVEIEEPLNPLCVRCPLTASARQAGVELAQVEQTLRGLAPAQRVEDLVAARDAARDAYERVSAECEKAATMVRDLEASVQANEKYVIASANVNELDVSYAEARERAQASRKTLDTLTAERDQKAGEAQRVAVELSQVEATYMATATLAERHREIASAEMHRAEFAEEIAAYDARLAGFEKALAEIAVFNVESIQSELDQARRAYAAAQSERDAVAVEMLAAERAVASCDGELKAIAHVEEKLSAINESYRGLLARHATMELLSRSLGRNGVQALEIDAAGPNVTSIANDLLASCYGPRFQIALETTAQKKDGTQKEVFDVRIIDSEAGRIAKKGSGGEQVILDEALRLALAIYQTQRSGYELKTLWRDETAGALDPESANHYVQMLRRARELGGFHQVFFIAHSPEVYEQADARILVEGGAVTID